MSTCRDVPVGEFDNLRKREVPPPNETTPHCGVAHLAKDTPLAFSYNFEPQRAQKKAPGTVGGAAASSGPQAQSSRAIRARKL